MAILLLGLNPNYTHAGVFSLISSFISTQKVTADTPESAVLNVQTIPLLEGDLNPNINAKGGGLITVVEGSALASEAGPLGTLSHIEELNRQISIYAVRKGDTLSQIAVMFDVSVNTIVWANDLRGKTIREGQTLVILPISGVEHTVKKGDTIKGIVKKYKADLEEILAFNDISEDGLLKAGQVLIIPNGEVVSDLSSVASSGSKSSGYPTISGYYIRPTNGIKTQGLHGYNGVDIGSPIGTPIVASATGVVIVAKTSGWNGGYGNYIVIKHNNGTQTLYAHMNSVAVSVGEVVSQKQKIGTVGSSGNSTGPHIHFEIRGAKNPF